MQSVQSALHRILSKSSTAFTLLAVFYIAFMFLPRLTPMGMFGDGLLYASLSRNLAEGTGSWWAPYFSGGYWLPEVSPEAYWENPPMMFWMQSMFFRVLGDQWWVEKLYAFLLLVINCLLIARVWSIPWRQAGTPARELAWLPVWFFYFIPIVVWGSPQNLIDSQLLMFCLLALWCLLKALVEKRKVWVLMSLATALVFAGILTKGPVALYPVCVPGLYVLILERKSLSRGIALSALLFIAVMSLFVLLLIAHEPARYFFTQYWEQRLSVAIEGGRADGLRTGWERLYIFWLLLRENSMILPVSLVLFAVAWKKGLVTNVYSYERRVALFFFVLAFCATVPVMASTRQAGMYLIPGLVLFAMAAGYLHAPLFMYRFARWSAKTNRIISALALIGIIAVIVHSAFIAGSPGRERELLSDMPAIRQHIPKGARVAICPEMMTNFVNHVYLQRFHGITLTTDIVASNFYLTSLACQQGNAMQDDRLWEVFRGSYFTLYQKQK